MSVDTAMPDIKWLETRLSRYDDLVAFGSHNGDRVTPELAMKTGVWMACARIIAETVASLPLHLYRRINDDQVERATANPLYRVLSKRPNSWQTRYEWVENLCLHLGFYGNAYQLKIRSARGFIEELHPLHAGYMQVEKESDHRITYLYRDPSNGRQTVYRDDQIMHIRWLSFDGVHGEVPTEIGKDAISLARSLEQYAATFYRNNAQPGVILHTDQALPREVREQLRDQWNNRHRGPGRAGETAILSNGLKADTISATNQESQLAELWMQALLAVCRVWRMPPHMVQELGRATWGNLASEMTSFEKFTIQPWLRRIEGAIERDLLAEDEDLYAEFLVEGLLRSDITTRYAAYESGIRNGWITPEEVRRKENMGPMPINATPAAPVAKATPEPDVETNAVARVVTQTATRAAANALKVGDFVSWGSGDGRGRGKITRVVRDGEINVPDSSFTITGTEDDPAALIRVYKESADGWKATDVLVGHKFSTLTKIDPLESRAAPDALDIGDFVSWGSGDGRGRGRITRVVRDGEINVPDSSFTITGTEDDPAALIRVYRELADGWSATDTLVGHKFSTLTKIDDLEANETANG